jgi:hypothetical protein
MRISTAVVIAILIVFIYWTIFKTSTGELFGITRPIEEPKVYYFGDFQDPQRFTMGMLGGVHGNEPAGSHALQELVENGWFSRAARDRINFIVIPRANEYGLQRDRRWTGSPLHPDLNRSFHERTLSSESSALSRFVLEVFQDADLVMDFHEGWGWHVQNSSSVGSTLSPTRTNTNTPVTQIADTAVDRINADITDEKQKFVMLEDISCDILSSLSCYMERSGKDYILMETTGQKNIQPLRLRIDQMHKAIETAVKLLKEYVASEV